MKLRLLLLVLVALAVSGCGGSREARGNSVVVTGSGPTEVVPTGTVVSFTMTVVNEGNDAATDIQLVDQVGSALVEPAITCEASGGAVCPAPASFIMTVASLPTGGKLVFTVTATVNATVSGTLTNTMTATLADDVDRLDNSAIVQLAVSATQSAVSVTGQAPTGVVAGGGSAEFVMTVRNAGPDAASGVRITESVGANLTLSTITCAASGGAVCPLAGLSMVVDSLPAGGSLEFRVTAAVAAGISGSVFSTMTVSADNDRNRDDNTVTAVATTYANNLSVVASAPAGPLRGGSRGSFGLVVTNSGPDAAIDAAITDVVSDSLTLDAGSIVCTASGGAVCPAALGASMVASLIPINGVLTFNVPFTVKAGASGTASHTASVSAAGDSRVGDNAASANVAVISADLGVSISGPATTPVGSSAAFTAIVNNPGPSAAYNVVIALDATGGTLGNLACTPAASCPATLGATMSLPSLAVGRTLTFTFEVPVVASPTSVSGAVSVSADGDASASNNSATFTALGIDARNGSYRVYAADGREYALTIDFDAGKYTMSGGGTSVERSFGLDASGGYSVVGTGERLRVATDIVIGSHGFGTATLPYIAARKFATTLASISGTYNLATRNVYGGTVPVSHAGTARVADNVLYICQSEAIVPVVSSIQDCSTANLKSYQLSASGDVFHGAGLGSAAGQSYDFRVGRSGELNLLLSADAANDGSQQLRIGLTDAYALIGGTLVGPAITATGVSDWVTVTLTPSVYSVAATVPGPSLNYSAPLTPLSVSGPFGMYSGIRNTDIAKIWVIQSVPVALVVGNFGSSASGDLQIVVP